jgi:tetratricopeptide (TPR) repeat protein
MIRFSVFGFAAVLTCAAALADDAPSRPPWSIDTTLERTTMGAVQSGGIRAVQDHLADLETALARAQDTIAQAGAGEGTRFVLTDGLAQTLIGMAAVATDKAHPAKGVAVPNPYPQIALLLGSYYDEVGRPGDAVRVLDLGIASDKILGIDGDTGPILKGERANALMTLKRFDEALAGYDDALSTKDLPPEARAHLLRGRGYALTELGRLDDAESAYRESLTLQPGNQTAQNELEYIARLRRDGGAKVPGTLKPLEMPTPAP